VAKKLRLACSSVLLCAAFAPGLARADVMELGEAGAVWVAGGPANGARTVSPASAPASHLSAETLADSAAGPDRWRSRVAALAARYDLSPALLEALVWQESRWHEGAVSPVGARGLAQLMPGTARQLGVNPDDPAANLEGGARYLREQLDRFGGDVEKALAAYNAGPRRVERAGGVPAIRETRLYVQSILARLASRTSGSNE